MTVKENLEICRRTYRERGCQLITITHLDGQRSGIGNPNAIRVVMDALDQELARQIAAADGAGKPAPMDPPKRYVILDPSGLFFQPVPQSVSLVQNVFTDQPSCAAVFATPEAAESAREKLLENLYEADGNTRVPKEHLRVAEVTYRTIG